MACGDSEKPETTEPPAPTESEMVVKAKECDKKLGKFAKRVEELENSRDAKKVGSLQSAHHKAKVLSESGKLSDDCLDLYKKLERKYNIVTNEISKSSIGTGQEIADQKAKEEEEKWKDKKKPDESCADFCKRFTAQGSAAVYISCENKCKNEHGE